jgi:hypothetical protein
LNCLTLKIKPLHTFRISWSTNTVTQHHILKHLNK